MPYQEAKVYCDGSHYIAIPHTTRKTKPRTTPPEEIIVVEEKDKRASESFPTAEPEATYEEASESKDLAVEQPKVSEPSKRSVTKKEYFEELYLQSQITLKGFDCSNLYQADLLCPICFRIGQLASQIHSLPFLHKEDCRFLPDIACRNGLYRCNK